MQKAKETLGFFGLIIFFVLFLVFGFFWGGGVRAMNDSVPCH